MDSESGAARLSTRIAGAEQCSSGVADGGVRLWLLRAAAGLLISVEAHDTCVERQGRGAAARGTFVTTTINCGLWR
jgi:hypothetical protein